MAIGAGFDGRNAPAQVDGVPWRYVLGIAARVGTLQGRRIMRPHYGLDLSDRVGRNLEPPDFRDIRSRVRRALAGLADETRTSIEVVPGDNRIRVRVTVGDDE